MTKERKPRPDLTGRKASAFLPCSAAATVWSTSAVQAQGRCGESRLAQ
ncbi:MAG: hypothetical protein II627_02310 [Lachnospiraceae bacterium]|nr:hypothetical protein [Lachnospiraceae bacterium]